MKRLLITDPYTSQSYDIILGLKDICEKVIVAVPHYLGKFSRIFCFAANSRLVTRVYYLKSSKHPSAQEIIFGDNKLISNKEKAYVNEIIDICKREEINLIYPSSDNEVVLLSKYAQEFKKIGIRLPINEYEILKSVLDKYNVIKLARKKGVPCPETHLIDRDIIYHRVEEWFTSPKIIKPRFGSTAQGIYLVRNKRDLEKWFIENEKDIDKFIIQEYIPGDKIIYYRVYMKRNREPLITTCVVCQRPEMIIHQSRGLVLREEKAPDFYRNIICLFREQKFIGYGHIQLKVDSRDGIPKLMEINARISRGTWTEMRLGLNGPLVSLFLFEDRDILAPIVEDSSRIIFVWPLQDLCIFLVYILFIIIKKCKKIFFNQQQNGIKKLPKVNKMLKHYSEIYLGRKIKKVYSNYFRFLLTDPFVSLCYWISFSYLLVKESKVRTRDKNFSL